MRPKSLAAKPVRAAAPPDFRCPCGKHRAERARAPPSAFYLPSKSISIFRFRLSKSFPAASRGGGENSGMVGAPGLEPGTSSLSEKRSNQLSYAPAGTLVEPKGLEPTTSCLQSRRSTS